MGSDCLRGVVSSRKRKSMGTSAPRRCIHQGVDDVWTAGATAKIPAHSLSNSAQDRSANVKARRRSAVAALGTPAFASLIMATPDMI